MAALSNFFYFIVAIGILVTFHEFGHFWVARKLGVKVLTFSVGFGKPLWKRKAKDGVLYQIGMIPLGGYVKMLDEREGEIDPSLVDQAFNRQVVWRRFAIVLAGPMANFLLAILFYWAVFSLGITGFNTKVGEVSKDSIAANAGVKNGVMITAVDGASVETSSQLIRRIALRLGDDDHLVLTTNSQGKEKAHLLSIDGWRVHPTRPQLLESLGIKHQNLVQQPLFNSVLEGGPADKAGIKAGDLVKAIDDEPVYYWNDLVKIVSARAGKISNFKIDRNGELLDISVVIGTRQHQERKVGFIGVGSDSRELLALRKGDDIFDSFSMALTETKDMIYLSVRLFGKLLVGDLSLKSLNGPFKIAEGAGGSARIGLVYFLSFLAMISINLGFINLLPVPLLDGGHLMYFSIEALRGKPLSEKVQEIGLQVGMLLVFSMMTIAIYNDITQTLG